jgi:RNA polymerase sigma-70 factor, ECF subfamily
VADVALRAFSDFAPMIGFQQISGFENSCAASTLQKKGSAMTETSQLRRDLPERQILTMPVAHDPLRAKTIGGARFKVTACVVPFRSATGTLDSGVRKGCEEHLIGADASDDALIKAIGCGDRHAMALLYGRHHVRVYRFALRITDDASSAEDVVSEVFLEAWRKADRFEARAQVSTWLLAIARNKSRSEVQRRSANHLDWETIEIEDPADDAEISSQKRDRSELIRRCLSQLSAVQREVIDLVYYHDKSVTDVASIVGVPANTVKTRMFHARRRIGMFLKAAGHADI